MGRRGNRRTRRERKAKKARDRAEATATPGSARADRQAADAPGAAEEPPAAQSDRDKSDPRDLRTHVDGPAEPPEGEPDEIDVESFARPAEPDRDEPRPAPRGPGYFDLETLVQRMEWRHVRFAFALIEHGGNRTKAAAELPNVTVPRNTGYRYAQRLDVRQLVAAIKANEARALGLTARQVLMQLWHEARFADDARARVTASTNLLKALGAEGPTKLEHSGPGGGAVELVGGVTPETIEAIRIGVLGQPPETGADDGA